MKVIAITKVFNEEHFLESWLNQVLSFCDTAILYDDGSTDRTNEILHKYLPDNHIIRNDVNDPANETAHCNLLMQRIHDLNLNPDWIFTNSIDEYLPANLTPQVIHSRLEDLDKRGIGIAYMKNAELYLHPHYMRLDNLWGLVAFVRFYKYKNSLIINDSTGGSPHASVHPPEIFKWKRTSWSERMLHFGYLEKERILRRFDTMIKCYEEGSFGHHYQYANWVRTLDLRTWKISHIPNIWLKDNCDHECTPYIPEGNWLISPEDTFRWKYIEKFGLHINPPVKLDSGL